MGGTTLMLAPTSRQLPESLIQLATGFWFPLTALRLSENSSGTESARKIVTVTYFLLPSLL